MRDSIALGHGIFTGLVANYFFFGYPDWIGGVFFLGFGLMTYLGYSDAGQEQ